jgi:hypothetical protein
MGNVVSKDSIAATVVDSRRPTLSGVSQNAARVTVPHKVSSALSVTTPMVTVQDSISDRAHPLHLHLNLQPCYLSLVCHDLTRMQDCCRTMLYVGTA